MAVFVIAIHTGPFSEYDNGHLLGIYKAVVNLAVPFFFVASGFFVQNNMMKCESNEGKQEVISDTLKKYSISYVKWSIVYLPIAVCFYMTDNNMSIRAIIWDYIKGFFFIGEHYNSWALWYLLASIYAYSFVMIAFRMRLKKPVYYSLIVFISMIAISMTIAFRDGSGCLKMIVEPIKMANKMFVKGRIFTGIFYIPLGMLIKEFEQYISKYKKWKSLLVMLIITGIITCSRTGFYGYVYEISRAITVTVLFMYTICSDIICEYSSTFRSMSQTVYFIHLLIWSALYTIIYHEKTFGFVPFISTVTVCLCIAFLYEKVRRKNI